MPDRARGTHVGFPADDEEAAGPVGSYIEERSSPFQHVRSMYSRHSVTGMLPSQAGPSNPSSPKRRSLMESAGAVLDLLQVRRSSTTASAPAAPGGRPLLDEETGTELAAPLGGMDREVEVLVETKEWGEGVSSSSDSEDWHFNRRQSLQKKAPHPKPSGSGEKGELEVQQQDHEWGAGMGLSDSSDSDSENSDPRGNLRNRHRHKAPPSDSESDGKSSDDEGTSPSKKKKKARFEDEGESDKSADEGENEEDEDDDDDDDEVDIEAARAEVKRGAKAVRARGSSATGKKGRSFGRQVAICSTSKTMGFIFFTMVYLLDNSLRVICMIIHYKSFAVQITFYIQAALMVIGATLSTYIVFHDTDVLLWMHHQRRQWQKLCVALMSFLVLGCLQLIPVKRAWSRQLASAQALSDLEDDKKKSGRSRVEDAMPGVSSAERIMPAALATGVPFLLVNHLWNSLCNVDKKISWAPEMITAANIVTSIAVSLAVSDLDFEVSNHVWKRYHLRNRTKLKGLKMLFPLLHRTFRFVEVYWRMQVLSGMVLIAKLIMKKVWDAQYADLSVIWMLPVVDFAIAVALLRMHSPGKDKAATHCAAGVAIVLSDLAHFVDRPNFAAPARAFSRALLVVRSLEWVVVCGALYGLITYGDVLDPNCIGTQRNEDLWPLLISGCIYYPLRMFFPISRLGHDLHTAAASGDVRRMRILLNADANGSVLDLNARSKDPLAQTPLMRAAIYGHADCVQLLLTNGAGVDEKTERDETALHYAAARCHIEVIKVLIRYKADLDLTDREGETALDKALACRDRPSPNPPTDEELKHLLTSDHGVSALASRRKTCQVPAQKATGLELKNLFPEVQEEDTPSPRVLQSVSALVVSRAAGTLSRRLLAREDERQTGTVALGALRRVRELGKGGFGKVIEVEVPSSASSTLFGQESTTRYALKLQLKQHQGQAHSEVLALQRAAHPFIVHLERAFTLDKYFALLLELCPTDLNKVLCEQDAEGRSLGLEPYRAARYMGQILLALSFLHTELKTVFRDLKPENILISLKDEAKLTDFGLAKVVTSAQRMTMCGTAGFWPPEMTATGAAHSIRASTILSLANSSAEGAVVVSEKSFGKKESERRPFKFDSYSFGVTLQLALLGEDAGRRREIHKKGPMMLPLHITEEENEEMLQNLKDSGRLSPEAYDLLVENTLCYEVNKRRCLFDPEVLQHPFFLNTLNCKDLQEGLIGSRNKEDSSPLRRMMGRFVGKGSSTDKLSAASSTSLEATSGHSM